MNFEIERKFLVKDMSFTALATQVRRISQGYIAHENGRTVRVRIQDEKGILTIKGPSINGISRFEWEREIPVQEARDLFLLCQGGSVDKSRYIIPTANGRKFEVDVFYGDNEGLVMAEIELGSEDEQFERPEWLGKEVTGDRRYYNSHLLVNPYKNWPKE